MDISLIQPVTDSISDLLMSQNGTRAIGLFLYLQKILIDAEFVLSLLTQGVCIKDRKISEPGSVYC